MTIFSIKSFVKDLWRKPLFRIFLSASILFVLFAILPISDLWNTIKQVSFGVWLLSVFALVGAHSIGVLKWSLLVNTTDNRLPLLDAFRCYFAGLFANIFLPSMTGGDIVRAGLAIRLKQPKGQVILGSLLDRVLDTGALALIILSGMLLFSERLFSSTYTILFVVFLLIMLFILCCVILFVAPLRWDRPKIFVKAAKHLHTAFEEFIKNPMRVVFALCGSIIIQMWLVFLSYFLACELGITLSFKVWLVIWPITKLSSMLPISMGGLGVREASLLAILSQFGISMTSSVGLGLLWESLFFAIGGTGGIFYFLAKRNIPLSKLAAEERCS